MHRARLLIRASRPVLEPMFLLAPRTVEEIKEDRSTLEAVWIAVVGEEKARRYFENNAKLAEMRKRGR